MKTLKLLLLICLTMNAGEWRAHAEAPDFKPASSISEIIFTGQPEYSKVVRIPKAKILSADYALIRKDFPQVKNFSDAQIDQWLLNQTAYISESQIQKGAFEGTNQPIFSKKSDVKNALRPRNYNRALVFEIEGGGLIDIKGVGSNHPSFQSHGNGLMETAEAIREHAFTKAVKGILHDAKADYGVVDSYAVIDWGFHLNDLKDGKTYRAGAVLRQAHVRDFLSEKRAQGQLDRAGMKKVEQILRKYGVTSAMAVKPSKEIVMDALNVQGTKDGKYLFDFGSYRVVDHFENKAVSLVDWGIGIEDRESALIFDPKNADFPQPDAQKRLDYHLWNGAGTNGAQEKIWLDSRQLAAELDEGKSIEDVRKKLEQRLFEYQKIHGSYPSGSACILKILGQLKDGKP